MPFLDRLRLGPARRRRRLERQLRELDRWDDTLASRPLRASRATRATRPRMSESARSALVLVTTVVVMVGLVTVVNPGLVPDRIAGVVGLGRDRLGLAPEVSGDGTYAFLAHQPREPAKPVAYDPCREIHVVLNPDGGPKRSTALLAEALRTMRETTGLKFVYDGTSDQRPRWSGPTRPLGLGREDPVLVSFATADEVPQLEGPVAGVGGSTSVSTQLGQRRYVTGQVTLDVASFRSLGRQRDGEAYGLAILLHELGHVVGLAHVADPGELMYAENLGLTEFGRGDRIGLAALGRGECF